MKAILAADEMPETCAAGVRKRPDGSLRKRDLTIGALFMFISALVVATVTVDMPPSHSARIILLIIAWLTLTLLINIVPLRKYFFGAEAASTAGNLSSSKIAPGPLTQDSSIRHSALPPAQSMPASNFGHQRLNTSEVVARPPSVTEQTTNLLSNK